MNKRVLGSTNIKISEIGLGCASYWGKKIFSEAQAIKIVHTALDKGINFLDTGHSYSDGNAEHRLGKALIDITNKNDLCISSKAGTRIHSNGNLYKDFSPKWIEESCHLSIKNIGLDHLPLFQLHGPAISDLNDELLDKLLRLKQEGTIGAIGINTFDDDVIEHIIHLKVFDFIMLDYNILTQHREPVIDRLYGKGIGVIAGAALADSLYSNRIFKIRGLKDLWYLARALKNFRDKLVKGRSFQFVNHIENMTGAQIAIAYVLNNPKISTTVFGTTSETHLLENLQGQSMTLSTELIDRIREADKLM
jgi:1-deoxyxylulose-5-phosphate synthase